MLEPDSSPSATRELAATEEQRAHPPLRPTGSVHQAKTARTRRSPLSGQTRSFQLGWRGESFLGWAGSGCNRRHRRSDRLVRERASKINSERVRAPVRARRSMPSCHGSSAWHVVKQSFRRCTFVSGLSLPVVHHLAHRYRPALARLDDLRPPAWVSRGVAIELTAPVSCRTRTSSQGQNWREVV